jgi:hypothetical protein
MINVICKPVIISTEKHPEYSDSMDSLVVQDISITSCGNAKTLLKFVILEINFKLDADRVLQFTVDSFAIDGKASKNDNLHFNKLFEEINNSIVVVNYINSSIEPDVELLPMDNVDDIIDAIDNNVDDKLGDIANINDLIDMFLSNDTKDEITAAAKELSPDDQKTLSALLKNIIAPPENNYDDDEVEDLPKMPKKLRKTSKQPKYTRRQTYIKNIRSMTPNNIPQLF